MDVIRGERGPWDMNVVKMTPQPKSIIQNVVPPHKIGSEIGQF